MKRTLAALAIILGFCMIANADVSDLIGEWELLTEGTNASKSVEYRTDGKRVLSSGRYEMYRFVDTDKYRTWDEGKETIWSFNVTNNRLNLVPISGHFAGGPPLVYAKVSYDNPSIDINTKQTDAVPQSSAAPNAGSTSGISADENINRTQQRLAAVKSKENQSKNRPVDARSITNAKLILYGYDKSYLVIPDNITTYEYLGHNPYTAFRFVQEIDEQQIEALTVPKLKQGSLGWGNDFRILSFEKIKGFEEIARMLKTADEFDIEAKKTQIKSKLKECYRNYLNEFNGRYLKETFTFRVIHDYDYRQKILLSHYDSPILVKETDDRRNHPVAHWMVQEGSDAEKISRTAYNFDRKTINLAPFGPYSRNYTTGTFTWAAAYAWQFNKKYSNATKKFPTEFTFPMSVEDAKKLFGAGDSWCVTLVKVKPKRGIIREATIGKIQRFDIVAITKVFFDGSHSFESPSLLIDIESTPRNPLY